MRALPARACASTAAGSSSDGGPSEWGGEGPCSTVHSAQHAPTHARSMLAPPTVALPTNAASAHGRTAHACSAHACSAHACSAHASTHACSTHACSVVARSVVARFAHTRSVPTNAPVIAKRTSAKDGHDGDGDGHDGGGRDGGQLDGAGRDDGRGGVPGHSDLRSAAQGTQHSQPTRKGQRCSLARARTAGACGRERASTCWTRSLDLVALVVRDECSMLADGARAPADHHDEVETLRDQAGPRSERACGPEGGDATLSRAAGCVLRAGALVGVGHLHDRPPSWAQ